MFSLFKNLYNWVLHWAYTPYGMLALLILSFSEASFFPVPPDVLLIALALGNRQQALKFALLCSVASILGAITGYLIGHYLWWNGDSYSAVAHFFFNNVPGFTEILFQEMQTQYEQFGFVIIFTAGFTPLPYKIFTISSGAFNIPILSFIMTSAISRSARFFLVSFLIWKFGEKIKLFIDRYFNLLSILFVIILFGSYFLINLIQSHRYQYFGYSILELNS